MRPSSVQPSDDDGMDEIPPDYEESSGAPPTNGITGASQVTVGESSVVLDPVVGSVSLQQLGLDHHDQLVAQELEHGPEYAGGESTGIA